jgi:hypothetical protein
MRIAKNVALLALPLWGLVLVLWLLSVLPNASSTPGGVVLFIGLLLIVVGGVPIYTFRSGIVGKVALLLLYFAACALAMFVLGWAALGTFGLAKSA